MARSNTLPVQQSLQGKGKAIKRSSTSASPTKSQKTLATTRSTTASPPPSKRHLSFPHPNPHHNKENKDTNGSRGKSMEVGVEVTPDAPSKSKNKSKYPPASQTGRPDILKRSNSVQTRYMNMLLNLDTIPRFHNILASFFTFVIPFPKSNDRETRDDLLGKSLICSSLTKT